MLEQEATQPKTEPNAGGRGGQTLTMYTPDVKPTIKWLLMTVT